MKVENKQLRQRLADDATLWQELQHDLATLNTMPEGKGLRQQVRAELRGWHVPVEGRLGGWRGELEGMGWRVCDGRVVGGCYGVVVWGFMGSCEMGGGGGKGVVTVPVTWVCANGVAPLSYLIPLP